MINELQDTKTSLNEKIGELLANRLLNFSVEIIHLTNKIPRSAAGRHVAGQLLRCGTSPGANYEEARGAESRRDFIHKLGIVLKELKGSRYWLQVTKRANIDCRYDILSVIKECQELCAIIAKSIITSRSNQRAMSAGS